MDIHQQQIVHSCKMVNMVNITVYKLRRWRSILREAHLQTEHSTVLVLQFFRQDVSLRKKLGPSPSVLSPQLVLSLIVCQTSFQIVFHPSSGGFVELDIPGFIHEHSAVKADLIMYSVKADLIMYSLESLPL